MKNAFYFILKAFFGSQDIYVFIITFWLCRRNGLIRKRKLKQNFTLIHDI